LVTECADAIGEVCRGARRIAGASISLAEVFVAGSVLEHVIDDTQEVCGDRDRGLLWSEASLEGVISSLEAGVLLAARR
jgi:hypothetical protein